MAINFRTIDGSGNNLSHPEYNAVGSAIARLGTAHFADDISIPRDGPNPRMISNVVVGDGDPNVPNSDGLSGMIYAWGQFIDHDLDKLPSGTTPFNISVPAGDPNFPNGSVIAMNRAVTAAGTGQDSAHPANAVNGITGWLDASMVYGSDKATAASLRLPDGHMRMSANEYLPVVNGSYLAGDARAAENSSLTALQTLFVREHNFQVERLHQTHPKLSGDDLYNQAKAIVAAEIQNITYGEFLPHILGANALTHYAGYNPGVDPRITAEFAGAAYRFGHSMVSAETERLGEWGQVLGPTDQLKDVFFMTPEAFEAHSGADGFLRHLASDLSQKMDGRIVEDLRNFLNDAPVAQDLAALNIQRGRDLGLGRLNETRVALGLKPYEKFSQITTDAATVADLQQAFGSIDQVDLWTGGLAEEHLGDAAIGSTFAAIIASQFQNLRDGDRFWFENQGFDQKTLSQIKHTKLSDIIARNTDTQHIQSDVFAFMERHSSLEASQHPNEPQLVVGVAGGAKLLGGSANDMLVAGTGVPQTLTGSAGDDRFVFDGKQQKASQGVQKATITDFQPGHDKLEFDNVGRLNFSDVHIGSASGHAVIHVEEFRIDLLGVQAKNLHAADFVI